MRFDREIFRDYLESLPDDLLRCVTADYSWLKRSFHGNPAGMEFRRRSECCRNECARRGSPEMYREAEESVALELV